MTLDGITLGAIVTELQSLVGAKIERIHQPLRSEVLLLLHTTGGKKRLVLSAQGGESRLHLTDSPRPNPPQAPNFCMLLRKYIGGGRIVSVRQVGLERIVHIGIEARDEMGVTQTFTLVSEIMGKYSNLMLLGPGDKILDSIHHVSFDMSRVRQVLPGMAYMLPELGKLCPTTASAASIADVLTGKTPPGCLVDALEGFSFATALEVCTRLFGDEPPALLSESQALRLAGAVKDFVALCLRAESPCLQKNADGMPVFFSPVAFVTYAAAGRIAFESANQAVDGYYTLRTRKAALEATRASLLKVMKKNITRVEKKKKIQLETLAAGQKADTYRLYGELLTANIYQVQRGMKSANVLNYYTGENISIPLDVRLSPSANATRYFKKVGKLKTGAAFAAKKSKEYADELAYLEELEYAATAADTPDDLEDIRSELIRCGYMELAPREKPRRSDPLERPHKFRTSDGFTVLAGRNSRQNDALTMRVAEATDWWFHSKNLPGSHVILFTGGLEMPPDTAILEAATIAATLCRSKNSPKIDVDYAPRAHVWKANGAKPGMVLYDKYYTLTMPPDPEKVESLRVSE
ncbi:MAG: NFACT family protein [Christensenellaceae bacterium]|nr:NFACT family protein [Christensenellaceae bacterium]